MKKKGPVQLLKKARKNHGIEESWNKNGIRNEKRGCTGHGLGLGSGLGASMEKEYPDRKNQVLWQFCVVRKGNRAGQPGLSESKTASQNM